MSSENIKDIRELVNQPDSCIEQKKETLQLLIYPCYTNNIRKGIVKAIEHLSYRYNNKLGGLVVGYDQVKCYKESAFLTAYISMSVSARFYVFSPKVGMKIKGVLKEKEDKQATFLLYGKYNVVFRTWDHSKEKSNRIMSQLSTLALEEECLLQVTRVAYRDHAPSLLGYPVPQGGEERIKEEEGGASPATARRVRFADSDDSGLEQSNNSDVATGNISSEEEELLDIAQIKPSNKSPRKKNKNSDVAAANGCDLSSEEEEKTNIQIAEPKPLKKSPREKKAKKSVVKHPALAPQAAVAHTLSDSDDDRVAPVVREEVAAGGSREAANVGEKKIKKEKRKRAGEDLQVSLEKPKKSKRKRDESRDESFVAEPTKKKRKKEITALDVFQ